MLIEQRITVFLCVLTCTFSTQKETKADLIPPGHKSVRHRMVFVDSPALRENRLIAAPVRGFGGFAEIIAGQSFSFSNKYGTRIYSVPAGYQPPDRFFYNEPLEFPHVDCPVNSITSVSIFCDTSQIETRCKILSVSDESITIQVLEEVEFDAFGKVTKGGLNLYAKIGISVSGLAMCLLIGLILRTRKVLQQAKAKHESS